MFAIFADLNFGVQHLAWCVEDLLVGNINLNLDNVHAIFADQNVIETQVFSTWRRVWRTWSPLWNVSTTIGT
jgi:hypothetical protein